MVGQIHDALVELRVKLLLMGNHGPPLLLYSAQELGPPFRMGGKYHRVSQINLPNELEKCGGDDYQP